MTSCVLYILRRTTCDQLRPLYATEDNNVTSCVLFILWTITRDQLCLLNSSDAYKLLKHTRPRLLNENPWWRIYVQYINPGCLPSVSVSKKVGQHWPSFLATKSNMTFTVLKLIQDGSSFPTEVMNPRWLFPSHESKIPILVTDVSFPVTIPRWLIPIATNLWMKATNPRHISRMRIQDDSLPTTNSEIEEGSSFLGFYLKWLFPC